MTWQRTCQFSQGISRVSISTPSMGRQVNRTSVRVRLKASKPLRACHSPFSPRRASMLSKAPFFSVPASFAAEKAKRVE